MLKKIAIALVLIGLFIVPNIGLAQNGWADPIIDAKLGEGAAKLLFGPEIPAEYYADWYSALQYLIFPFVSLWAIIFGILSQIRIFRRKEWIHILLSFTIAAMSGPTGGLIWLVRYVFVAYGWYGFLIFAVLLGAGTWLWGGAMFWEEFGFKKGPKAAREKMHRKIKLDERIANRERMAGQTWRKAEDRKRYADEAARLMEEEDDEFGR